MTTPWERRGLQIVERPYRAGTAIFLEGEETRELYVLLQGKVEITKRDRHVTTIDRPGSYFGELSSLLGVPRTATARTATEARLLIVPPDRVTQLFGESPEVGFRMAQVLARRLAETTEELVENCEWLQRHGPS